MNTAHKCLAVFWLLVTLYVIVFLSKPIISRVSHVVDVRQEYLDNSSYSVWARGDYYSDRRLNGEVYREFCMKDYYRFYGEDHSYFHVYLLISKDTPPSKFKLHFGNWGKIGYSSRVANTDSIVPHALFYTPDSYSTYSDLEEEIDDLFRSRVFFDKTIVIFAVKLTHPERLVQEVRVCLPEITGSNPVYNNGENYSRVLSKNTTVALNISEPMPIDIVKPFSAISRPPRKTEFAGKVIGNYIFALFTTPMTLPFSWGLVLILSCHLALSKKNQPHKFVKITTWIMLPVSYLCVIGSIILYCLYRMAVHVMFA